MVNRKPDARQGWLDVGLQVLTHEGAERLRIDHLATLRGVTKGSFHHHFEGADGFKTDLLGHIEQLLIDTLNIAIAALEPEGDAHATLAHLTALVSPSEDTIFRPDLERALRAWATWDSDAHATQARIDAARIGALARVWRPHVADDAAARVAALLPYLIAVGAASIVPAVDGDELKKVYETLLPLVPSGPNSAVSLPASQRRASRRTP